MEALMKYWHTGPRRDAETGLHFWHDIMESGADDIVWDPIPSNHSAGWIAEERAFTISAPDLMTFLFREHIAFARLLESWAASGCADGAACAADALEQRRLAAGIRAATNTHLFYWENRAAGAGWYCGYDRRTRAQILCRTYQMAWPLWAGMAETSEHAAAAARAILAPDMRSRFGIRSTSTSHPLYSNENRITPYSESMVFTWK
jgi:neutral trehalase